MAATGRMASKRLSDDTAAEGIRDLMTLMNTSTDTASLQQLQKDEQAECHEQCKDAASKIGWLQHALKALTAAKIENFSA